MFLRSIAAAALSLVAMHSAVAAGSPEKGKAAFIRNGCWQCHGFEGQGGSAGKKLAPDPLPLPAFMGFVRATRGPMPPYQKAVLSDDDLADIHAWLATVPKARDYRTIPLLAD